MSAPDETTQTETGARAPVVPPVRRPPNRPLCFKCDGRGLFYFGGAVVNGVYTGRTGACYACRGKGWLTRADQQRNRYYWAHVARVSP